MQLDMPVSALKGVGPARVEQLSRLGIATVGDLLACLPREYQDLAHCAPLSQAHHGQVVAVRGCFRGPRPRPAYPRPGMTIVQARLTTDSGSALCLWYNQPWMARALGDDEVVAIGTVDLRHGAPRLINPVLETGEGLQLPVLPIYPLTQGLSQKQLRQWTRQALDAADMPETLPEAIRAKLALMGRAEALRAAHFPPDLPTAAQARRRLDCEELLLYGSLLRRQKQLRRREGNRFPIPSQGVLEAFLQALPYRPTGAQARVIGEICPDLAGDAPMNRLVQGDVGSGKTLVALAALYLTAKAGYQGALMAPTEVLAQQLFAQARELLGPLGVRVGLMTAGIGTQALRRARDYALVGSWDIVVGTHALIQGKVAFDRLALVVTDEQHRFGVLQRAALREKGDEPHMLVMSATPLPRTLGLLLFADLELSRVDELPPGRKPIKTRCVSGEKRMDMYRYLAQKAQAGEQAYIICPAIEENEYAPMQSVESLWAELSQGVMAGAEMAMLHGRMGALQKEAVLEDFRQGRVKVLISTTVIEVGINVPNATAIVIEDAHRFGLAQLHQLRGRVGRGEKESYCFLVSDQAEGPARARLNLLCTCQDGFTLAEEDMRLRGPGEFLGTRQAGLDGQVAALLAHPELAGQAMALLDELFSDPGQEALRDELLAAAQAHYAGRLDGIVMN